MDLKSELIKHIQNKERYKNEIIQSFTDKGYLKEDINYYLNKLKADGTIIYIPENNKYKRKPNEYFVTTIYKDTKGVKYVNFNSNRYYNIHDTHYNAGDKIFIVPLPEYNFVDIKGLVSRGTITCTVKIHDNKPYIIPFNPVTLFNIYTDENYKPKSINDIYLNPQILIDEEIKDGDRIIIKPNDYKVDGIVHGNFIKKLCHENDKDAHTLTILANNELEVGFTKDAEDEANNIINKIDENDLKGRVDLTNEVVFTIDGKETKDIDDALSIKIDNDGEYTLKTHIADVSHYLLKCPHILENALSKGTSVYLNNMVEPMIPRILSNGLCSLNENQVRLTITTEMRFNKYGEKISSKVYKSYIYSRMQMRYEDLNEYYETGKIDDDYKPYLKDLKNMLELSKLLTNIKNNRGYLKVFSNELKFEHDMNNNVINSKVREDGIYNELIENFMLETNNSIALFCESKELPLIYRVHDFIDKDKFKTLMKNLKQLAKSGLTNTAKLSKPSHLSLYINSLDKNEISFVATNIILLAMAKAIYSLDALHHFGLNLYPYTHFTSPIRRSADLINHIAISKYLEYDNVLDIPNNDLKEISSLMSSWVDNMNDKEYAASIAEVQSDSLSYFNLLDIKSNDKYSMFITKITPRGIVVCAKGMPQSFISLKNINSGKIKYDEINKTIKLNSSDRILRIGDEISCKPIGFENYQIVFSTNIKTRNPIHNTYEKDLSEDIDPDNILGNQRERKNY